MAKILIIEDDLLVGRFYEKLFRLKNYDIEIATNGPDGIEIAKKGQTDLILLDIIMPKIDGLETLKRLKKDPATRNINVIMLTNIDDSQIAKKAASLGAVGFIVKSQFDPENLTERINNILKT